MKKGILALMAIVGALSAISFSAEPALAYQGDVNVDREALMTEWMTTCNESSYEAWKADRVSKGVVRKIDSFDKFQIFCDYWAANEAGDTELASTLKSQLTLGQRLQDGTGTGSTANAGLGSGVGTGYRGQGRGQNGDGVCELEQ